MWFFGLIVVLLIGAVAVVASGRWGAMAPSYDDRPDLTVPARHALTADDLAKARFGIGLRGYRMDEVDTLLERVTREVAERDRRIADLERAVSPIIHGPEGAGFTSRSEYDAGDFEDTGYNKPILVGGDFPTPVDEVPEEVQEEDELVEESEPAAVLDGPPAPVPPLPPLLQELVHTHEEDEPEPTPWFQAKEPPPDHTPGTDDPAGQETGADPEAEAEGDEGGEARGRHSAAPDVGAVQRPN